MEKHNLENDILLKPFIEWMDKYMTEMEETKLFSTKDKIFRSFGIRSNNFDLREITEVDEDDYLIENNDDIINIRLPLNTLDVYNDECIYNFIYKEGNLYEPIYYFNDYYQMEKDNMECDIKYNIHTDSKINEYIKNILDGIKFKITNNIG